MVSHKKEIYFNINKELTGIVSQYHKIERGQPQRWSGPYSAIGDRGGDEKIWKNMKTPMIYTDESSWKSHGWLNMTRGEGYSTNKIKNGFLFSSLYTLMEPIITFEFFTYEKQDNALIIIYRCSNRATIYYLSWQS